MLERIAGRFEQAGVPLMVLKGAALQLTALDRPDERMMADLDLLVRPVDADAASTLLASLGAEQGDPLVRDDFFPRFHYETEYTIGSISPVKIDLHVRPFRPTRYAATLPADAFWRRAAPVRVGSTSVLVPGLEDMLIHLVVHAAVHGCPEGKWPADIRRWASRFRERIDWVLFLDTVVAWRLAWPVRQALLRLSPEKDGGVIPAWVMERLNGTAIDWRDRLTLWQAPRDATHSATHVAVNVVCTPGWRFKLSYLAALAFPSEAHMADWYARRHPGWLAFAHALRWLGPMWSILPASLRGAGRIDIKASPGNGVGVFAASDVGAGEWIAKGLRRRWARSHFRTPEANQAGNATGVLRHLNHSCQPNAKFVDLNLVAIRPIAGGQEITIDFGSGACRCRNKSQDSTAAAVN